MPTYLKYKYSFFHVEIFFLSWAESRSKEIFWDPHPLQWTKTEPDTLTVLETKRSTWFQDFDTEVEVDGTIMHYQFTFTTAQILENTHRELYGHPGDLHIKM